MQRRRATIKAMQVKLGARGQLRLATTAALSPPSRVRCRVHWPVKAQRRPLASLLAPVNENVMRIVDVRAIPLLGRITEGGWEQTLDPEQNSHTLVEVVTDAGMTGIGSAYTSVALVEASLRLLRPWVIGECAIEPERVCEKLHQMTFWQGRGGAVTHAISGIDIALWDLLGKATGQPVARLLGGCYRDRIRPYGSILFDDPPKLREKLSAAVARGFRSLKLGWNGF